MLAFVSMTFITIILLMTMSKVLENLHLIDMVFDFLQLPDLLHCGQASRAFRRTALAKTKTRYHNILFPFLNNHIYRFNYLLHHVSGMIIGSCALNMLLSTPTYPVHNLNLIVPYGGWRVMENFILDILRYTRTPMNAHAAMPIRGRRFRAYGFQGLRITLTETTDQFDALQIVADSLTTLDMTVMTPGGIATFYPELTLNSIGYLTHSGERLQTGQPLGSMASPRFQIEQGTQFLGRGCGLLCPALWRHVNNHEEYLAVDWDIRYSVKKTIQCSDLEWRMSTICRNKHCPFYVQILHSNSTVPPNPIPENREYIDLEMHNIRVHQPARIYLFFFGIQFTGFF